MKIGILTLTLHTNYGGILQAYALQTVLERMGHEVVVFNRPFTPLKTKWGQIPKRIIKKLLGRDVVIFSERKYNREAPILNQHVWEFRKKYIHERIIDKLIDIKEGDVDCIVVGSDQVWRPKYFKSQWQTGIEDAYLAFTKGWNIKRVAYAASFGVDTWEYTPEETEKCREAIKMFDAISVREDSGVEMLKAHFYVHAAHVLDPTLLLYSHDYTALTAMSNRKESFLLTYILDCTIDKENFVQEVVRKKGLARVDLKLSQKDLLEKNKLTSIDNWLSGFRDADFVVTDSFHGSVFSIIFRKPFVVMPNIGRGADRIYSLLNTFNLQSNILTDKCDTCKIESLSPDDTKIMDSMRNESFGFLNNVLCQ